MTAGNYFCAIGSDCVPPRFDSTLTLLPPKVRMNGFGGMGLMKVAALGSGLMGL